VSILAWHFIDYPDTWDQEGTSQHWSDEVLVKALNDGKVHLANYCKETEEWLLDDGQYLSYDKIACWAYYGVVPETEKPMPRRSGV